jgi:DNA-binding GntR family transcriptional regulator
MAKDRSSGFGAYDLLLDAIESGALPPGSRLREVELAARFGISRTPIREALKRLEVQGLVSHQPHYGAIVHATPTEIEILQEMIEHDRSLIGDPKELARRNKLFHRQIHQSSRNRFLSTMLDNMRTSLLLLSGTTLASPNRAGRSLEEHQVIVNAVAMHDPIAAEAAARQHIINAFKTRLELRAFL